MPAASRLCLLFTFRCPAFDLLLHSAARPSSSITAIEAEVVGVISVVCGSSFDDSELLSLLLLVAVGGVQAAWSCKTATQAAAVAPESGGHNRAARAGVPRISGGLGGAAWLAECALVKL